MVAAHYVLQNPHIRQRLEAELREAWPVLEEVPRYEVLEKLPYLVRPRCPGEGVAFPLPAPSEMKIHRVPCAGRRRKGRPPHVPEPRRAPTHRA